MRRSFMASAQLALTSTLLVANLAGAQEETKPPSTAEAKPAEAQPVPAKPRPHIDLAFCIDTTGSMQGEIDVVKAKTKEIVAKLSGGKPAPVIRVGLVAFRDLHDDYVTKVFPFTDDIDQVVKDISDLKAQGGGDAPEAVASALHASVHDLKWDTSSKTLKLLFVIGDAGPTGKDRCDWRSEAKDAIAGGIQINTIGCDGLQNFKAEEGRGVFEEIAKLADGKFEFMSYKSEVAQADGTKATIVHAAGKMYKMKTADAAAWRAGAKDLEARGIATEMSSPLPAASTGTPVAGALLRRSTTRGMYFTAAGKAARPAGGGGAGAAYYSEDEGGSSFSRGDNNLADMVLDATKSAADKKLQVKFDTSK